MSQYVEESEEKLHPIDVRVKIEDGCQYTADNFLRMNSQGVRMYFDNLIRLGVSAEDAARRIFKITKEGKFNLLNEKI